MFTPPQAQDWHHEIEVGDFLAKRLSSRDNFWLYQKVEGMSSSRKTSRFVKGFSLLCMDGELGDTYLGDVEALIDPELWKILKALGWPSDLEALKVGLNDRDIIIHCDMIDRNGHLCPILRAKCPALKFG